MICRNEDNSSLMIIGGKSTNDSAFLQAYGKNNHLYPGVFSLNANIGNGVKSLVGFPDGALKWNNNSLSDITVKQKSITNNGYISFSCELIIQWGSFMLTDEQLQKTFPIPISYTTQFYGLYVSNQNGTKRYFAYSNNLANITVGELTGYAADPLMWFSLGK